MLKTEGKDFIKFTGVLACGYCPLKTEVKKVA